MYINHIEIFSGAVYFQKFKALDLYCVYDTNIEYIQVECCCVSVLNNIIIKKANRSV